MARILLIDTSTAVLSVGLSVDGTVVEERICTEARQQASLTAPLVKEVLDAQGISVKDCDAVCVGSGPGSYTGLRVGVSTAKGLAFGAGKPLLAVGTLDILAAGVEGEYKYIVPMIDARRMEVYTAVYSPAGEKLTPIQALVVEEDSFAEQLEAGPVLFVGDGALKCREVIRHPNARFQDAAPLVRYMAPLAEEAYAIGRFENLAYFEPFYLKDFVATVSRKALW
jgi:tRNA threonylcarbamoyladenosine biosynthesis protein TsaB